MRDKMMINSNQLLDNFKNIKEFEDRRITYSKAIEEVEKEIEHAKSYHRKQEPQFYCIDYDRYNNQHTIRFILFWIVSTPILIAMLSAILYFVWHFFGVADSISRPITIISGIIGGLLVAILLQQLLYDRVYHKKEKEYQNSYKQIEAYNNDNKEAALNRSEQLRNEKDSDLTEWRSYITQITERLASLYTAQIIPEKYQNPIAISFFVSYLESGRCDTLKECMNKYDDDMMYYQLKGKIEDVYQRINQMEGKLSREIRGLQMSIKMDLEDMQLLIDNNKAQMERISYNQRTNDLLLMSNLM